MNCKGEYIEQHVHFMALGGHFSSFSQNFSTTPCMGPIIIVTFVYTFHTQNVTTIMEKRQY